MDWRIKKGEKTDVVPFYVPYYNLICLFILFNSMSCLVCSVEGIINLLQ
jgi:hypothetical protein